MSHDTTGIETVLSLGDIRYVVVRPHRGMKNGHEVINAWNQKRMAEFSPGNHQEAVDYARAQVAQTTSFDRVLTTVPPADQPTSDSDSDSC